MTTQTPSAEDLRILAVLDEHAGMVSWEVLRRCPDIGAGKGEQRFEEFAGLLRDLEKRGFVSWLATPKPWGCWVRTPAGSKALESAGREEG